MPTKINIYLGWLNMFHYLLTKKIKAGKDFPVFVTSQDQNQYINKNRRYYEMFIISSLLCTTTH